MQRLLYNGWKLCGVQVSTMTTMVAIVKDKGIGSVKTQFALLEILFDSIK